MLQNPEMRKKAKYQLRPLDATPARSLRVGSGSGRETSISVGIVSMLTGYSFGAGKLEPLGRSASWYTRRLTRSSLAVSYRVQAKITSCHGNESHHLQRTAVD